MSRRQIVADLLFWVQLLGAFVICTAHFFRILENIEGVSLSAFCLTELYMLLHLTLAISSNRMKKSRVAKQAICIYSSFFVLVATNIVAVFLNGYYEWGVIDNVTVGVAFLGSFVVILLGGMNGFRMRDPMIKSFLAILYKALPNFFIAWKIAEEGAAGVPGLVVILANVTSNIRACQTWFLLREAGWDKNRNWLFISEVVNVIGIGVLSVFWLIWAISL